MGDMKAISPVHKFKPAHHTPVQTKKWMVETFAKAKERFSHFYEILDARKPIPDRYLSSKSSDGQGCNRTLRFYRLESLIEIVAAIRDLVEKGKPGIKELTKLNKEVLIPFDECWLSLFNKLDTYYGNKETTTVLRAKYDDLRFASKVFQGGADSLLNRVEHESPNRNLDIWEDQCTEAFKDFTLEFAKLPRKSKLNPPKDKPIKQLDKTTEEYTTNDLIATWNGVSKHEGEKHRMAKLPPLAKKANLMDYTLVPTTTNETYFVTCKFTDGNLLTFKFKISSNEAKAFIDLLIENEDMVKPWVIAKKGKKIGLPTKQDFRLAQFNSTIKKASPLGNTYGSKDFWRFFIVPRERGSSDRKVKLGISDMFINEINHVREKG